jgi:hypothetical protein
MEALQMLKFALNNDLNFTDHLLTPEEDLIRATYTGGTFPGDLLARLTQRFNRPSQREDVVDEIAREVNRGDVPESL